MTNRHTHTAATNCIGVILAGGQSTRMGTDKAGLLIDDESLLMRARRLLQTASCNRVVLSGHARPEWTDEIIADQLNGMGPVGGIISAIDWAEQHGARDALLLFIPVDAPLLSPDLLRAIQQAALHDDGSCVLNSPLPLALRATSSVRKQCALAKADLRVGQAWSVKRFIEPLELSPITATETIQPQLVNVNTPTQWENLRRELENCP